MKNIAILVPTLNKGGAERVAANISLEFAKYYNVYLIVHDGRNVIYPYGGKLIDLQLPPAKNKFGKITTLFKRVHALRKLKKQYHIDITISHLPASNYVNIFSKVGDRIFTYIHCMEKWSFAKAIREWFTAKMSDNMICVSECVRRNMIDTFHVNKNKVVTIYNFCDLDCPPTCINQHSEIVVSTMGRLTEQKGQWHLIRAMKKVVEKSECPVILKIIGDGELRSQLNELTQKLELQDKIIFTGFLDDPWSVLADTDIYVSSSLWEGLPMALVEAGRCGLPIISTDCDAGCREILAPTTDISNKATEIEKAEYGILLPVFNTGNIDQKELTHEENLMADAIIELINNTDLRSDYAIQARNRSEHFRSENIMKQWVNILE